MAGKKVLFINQEIIPYVPETELSRMGRDLPQQIQENGFEIRTFMPKWGNINERRGQLHEVIRLSGMNIIINDLDQPLIVKVASLPGERLQVYFVDNEEYFKRKLYYKDENGEVFDDNDERAIFFARGVVETIKKLNWVPDVIHLNGWMASFVAIYLKNYYKTDSYFHDTRLVLSVFDEEDFLLNEIIADKLKFDGITDLKALEKPTVQNFIAESMELVDLVLRGEEELSETLDSALKNTKTPKVDFNEEAIVDLYQ